MIALYSFIDLCLQLPLIFKIEILFTKQNGELAANTASHHALQIFSTNTNTIVLRIFPAQQCFLKGSTSRSAALPEALPFVQIQIILQRM